MVNKCWFKNLPVILLAVTIALSPSFSFGTLSDGKIIEIRMEDFLIVILGLVWLANFLVSGKKRIEKPPLLLPILAWLGIGFFSLLTNWIFGDLGLSQGFFYFLKEVEFFFLYFYLFYHIRNLDTAKFFIKLWIALGLMNVGWVIYQMVGGFRFATKFGLRTGEYLASAIGEWGVFPTGAFFLMIFIFLFNILVYYFLNSNISIFRKGILSIITLSPTVGIIGSASKTNFVGLVFAVFLTSCFLFLKKKKLKTVLTIALVLVFIFGIVIFSFKTLPFAGRRIGAIFKPVALLINYEGGRFEPVIKPLFEETLQSSLYVPFFGLGKGRVGEAHNQYLRNFVETGTIGSIIFLILIFAIIKRAWQGFSGGEDRFLIGLSGGLLVATLTMLFFSLATEPFVVVKPSEVYWFFAATTMAVLSFNKKIN